jgi:hypothetical protein
MACSSCSPSTCNCTPTAICETCIDVTSSECIYYKGYITNNLGLASNFRFNTFAEKVIDVLGGINSVLDTYPVSIDFARDLTLAHPSGYTTTLTLNRSVSIDGAPATDTLEDTVDQRYYHAYSNFDTASTISISSSGTVLPLTAGVEYGHNINVTSDSIETGVDNDTQVKRLGKQRVTFDLGYSITPSVAVYMKVVVYSYTATGTVTTALKTYYITLPASATSDVLSCSFIDAGPTKPSSSILQKDYYVKVFCTTDKAGNTSSTQTLTIDSGSLLVEESGY